MQVWVQVQVWEQVQVKVQVKVWVQVKLQLQAVIVEFQQVDLKRWINTLTMEHCLPKDRAIIFQSLPTSVHSDING